jgi:hypothetical protein
LHCCWWCSSWCWSSPVLLACRWLDTLNEAVLKQWLVNWNLEHAAGSPPRAPIGLAAATMLYCVLYVCDDRRSSTRCHCQWQYEMFCFGLCLQAPCNFPTCLRWRAAACACPPSLLQGLPSRHLNSHSSFFVCVCVCVCVFLKCPYLNFIKPQMPD